VCSICPVGGCEPGQAGRESNILGAVGSVSIIVPLYNEAAAVAPLHGRLMPVVRDLAGRWTTQVLLVDDGSTDDTAARLAKTFADTPGLRVSVIRHPSNLGIGAALATGFKAATGDVVCVMDSDCTYAPEELPKLIDLLVTSNADIVTASPYHPDGMVENCPGWRIALSKIASRVYGFLSPVKLHCFTAIFRAYRREWARPEFCGSRGFVGVAQILLTAAFAGATIVEHPTTLHRRTHGVSKMRVLSVGASHLRLMFKTALMRMIGGARTEGAFKAIDAQTK
jgi:dolichol-phosphate mannosyltransferase